MFSPYYSVVACTLSVTNSIGPAFLMHCFGTVKPDATKLANILPKHAEA